jgi:pilus assembly protein FimV
MRGSSRTLRKLLILVAGVILSALAGAADLGAIRLLSGMGQPLSAEIPVSNVQPNEFELLAVRLAPPEFFSQARVKHMAALTRLNLRVARKADGAVVIILTTRESVTEPVLAFLLEFYGAHGRILREYTVLLDAERMLAAEKSALAAESVHAVGAVAQGGGEYGPVRKGETLRAIVRQQIHAQASESQVLAATFNKNPQAFESRNINRLRHGGMLSLPQGGEVESTPASAADALVARHNAEWDAWREQVVAAAGEVSGVAGHSVHAAPVDARLRISTPADAERLQQIEEEVAAKQHALKEIEVRIAELEKVVADMQHLMELRLKEEQQNNMQRYLIWSSGALAVLAVVGAGFWFWRRRKAESKPDQTSPAKSEPAAEVSPEPETDAHVEQPAASLAGTEGPLDLSDIDLDLNAPPDWSKSATAEQGREEGLAEGHAQGYREGMEKV